MKTYQSIEHTVSHDIPVIVFDKLDGSNIRAEWNRKQKKFYKFGEPEQNVIKGLKEEGERVLVGGAKTT